MRTLPADIQARIDLIQQTIYENANPLMTATIVKATQDVNIFTVSTGARLGSIDLAFVLVDDAITFVWIIMVIDGIAYVNVYDFASLNWEAATSSFNLTVVNAGASVKSAAITMDGSNPWLFWVERTATNDIIYTLQWDGSGAQPAATELLSVAR